LQWSIAADCNGQSTRAIRAGKIGRILRSPLLTDGDEISTAG
jgi:hypothetical protein